MEVTAGPSSSGENPLLGLFRSLKAPVSRALALPSSSGHISPACGSAATAAPALTLLSPLRALVTALGHWGDPREPSQSGILSHICTLCLSTWGHILRVWGGGWDVFRVIVQPTMVRALSGELEGLWCGAQGCSHPLGPLRGLPAWAQIPLGFCAPPSGAGPAPKASVLVSSLFLRGPPGGQSGSLWLLELPTDLGALMPPWSPVGGLGLPGHSLLFGAFRMY